MKTKPARLRKKTRIPGRYGNLCRAGQSRIATDEAVGRVSFTIGEGAKAVTTRFGSDTSIQGAVIRTFIDEARHALKNPNADVVLRVEELRFQKRPRPQMFAKGRSSTSGPEKWSSDRYSGLWLPRHHRPSPV